jgi:hypothetical protein
LVCRSARYGWVQEKFNSPEDFNEPARFAWMQQVMGTHPGGISITSMEVWHAVLGADAPRLQQPHAFFAFRDDAFLSGRCCCVAPQRQKATLPQRLACLSQLWTMTGSGSSTLSTAMKRP